MSHRNIGSRFARLACLVALLHAMGGGGVTIVEGQEMSDAPFPRRQRISPLPEDLDWLNTAAPIGADDLRGKFVLLDFWTYCCINCMHILPELEKLEKKYPNNLLVIGVHSAKFENERDTKNIAEAILRYHIAHPVINDADHAIWNLFGVRSWPSVLLIDPEGYAVWGTSGEITADQVDVLLRRSLPYYRKKGLLDEEPLRTQPDQIALGATPLFFPGKLLADEAGDRLFVADSSHNRIVVTRLDGGLVDVIGSGVRGQVDGRFAAAQFNDPQGMAINGDTLYVADTKNHLIRKVDLTSKQVATIAGTGQQLRGLRGMKMSEPETRALASPWALWIHQDDLFIAMAGPHQIWRMPLDESAIGPFAGNGREDIVDGPPLPTEPYQQGYASFAQPSGLTSDGERLYVADSEGSSIRAVPFRARGKVQTVVGTSHLAGARLFTFGDVDGAARLARMQHPLGVAYHDGVLYVADTYNNKIKTVDPATGETRTLLGDGQPGASDDPPRFDEPAGVSVAGGKLYVADTNNHLIRVVDLSDEHSVSTLSIPGLQAPEPVDEMAP